MLQNNRIQLKIVMLIAFLLLSSCTANSYGRLMGTAGEIRTEADYWLVEVYDTKGRQHHIRVPIRGTGQAGYNLKTVEMTLQSGVDIDVVTGPRHTVRRLQIKKSRFVLPLLPPSTPDSSAIEREKTE